MRKLFSIICLVVPGIQLNVLLGDWRLGGKSSPKKLIWSWIIFQVIYACFALRNFCEYRNTYIMMRISLSYKLKLQNGIMKRWIMKIMNNGNAPNRVYSWNISEEEVVRRILIEYIKTSLPDHLVTWKIKYSITFTYNR